MTTNKRTWIAVAVLVAAAVGTAANARTRTRARAVTPGAPGPANYHAFYDNVKQTTITIENFTLRTNDGKAIPVDTKGTVTIDLNDLRKLGKGIEIDTRNAQFPSGVTILDVVEVETTVSTSRAPFLLFTNPVDGKQQCSLTAAPKKLNFYTLPNANGGQGIQLVKGADDLDVYRMKIDYTALNAIQFDYITTTVQDGFPCDCMDEIFGNTNCSPSKPTTTEKVLKCEMVNRRLPIIDIVRKRDDF